MQLTHISRPELYTHHFDTWMIRMMKTIPGIVSHWLINGWFPVKAANRFPSLWWNYGTVPFYSFSDISIFYWTTFRLNTLSCSTVARLQLNGKLFYLLANISYLVKTQYALKNWQTCYYIVQLWYYKITGMKNKFALCTYISVPNHLLEPKFFIRKLCCNEKPYFPKLLGPTSTKQWG